MAAMTSLPHPHSHENTDPSGKSSESIRESLPPIEEMQTVSDALKQLGDPTRLQIFWILCHCEECVTNIAAIVNMSSPAVSHHLRLLKSGGLVTSRRIGKEMRYKASSSPLSRSLHRIIEEIVEITCPVD